jgi:[acyl-carrier-protein] S-malonyltransferase
MGKDLHDAFASVRELFDMAEEICHLNLRRLCFEGPLEELTQTVNLQPALTAVNLAFLTLLPPGGPRFEFAAGHSLGEYSALCAAGVLAPVDTLGLVLVRGRLMQREATRHAGIMHAIVGLTLAEVEETLAAVGGQGVVSVANHNSETQIVITGSPAGVHAAAAALTQRGARAIPLRVSGAWHSALMAGASEEFSARLAEVPFADPRCPVVLNVTGKPCSDAAAIRDAMGRQLGSPVRWYDAMRQLIDLGVTDFVEIGPGIVLAGLLRKILPPGAACTLHSVNSLPKLEAFINASA